MNRLLSTHAALALVVTSFAGGCGESYNTATIDGAGSVPQSEPVAEAIHPPATKRVHEFQGPRDVIVEGRLTVDVMELMAPQRMSELAQRMKRAANENPDWWLEHAKKRKPGEPLPYDARLGMSESEYNEFLSLGKKLTMQKKAEATLVISVKDDDVYVLDGGELLAELTGIEIDLGSDVVRTPFGIATQRTEIHATEDTPSGAWDGVQWKLEKVDLNGITGRVVKLAVGTLKPSGRCILYYDVKVISNDGKSRISIVLNYDLPESP